MVNVRNRYSPVNHERLGRGMDSPVGMQAGPGPRVYPPGEKAALYIPLPTAAGGYGECSAPTKQPALIVGYVEAGAQPGGGGAG
jgi:hypothetical protein